MLKPSPLPFFLFRRAGKEKKPYLSRFFSEEHLAPLDRKSPPFLSIFVSSKIFPEFIFHLDYPFSSQASLKVHPTKSCSFGKEEILNFFHAFFFLYPLFCSSIKANIPSPTSSRTSYDFSSSYLWGLPLRAPEIYSFLYPCSIDSPLWPLYLQWRVMEQETADSTFQNTSSYLKCKALTKHGTRGYIPSIENRRSFLFINKIPVALVDALFKEDKGLFTSPYFHPFFRKEHVKRLFFKELYKTIQSVEALHYAELSLPCKKAPWLELAKEYNCSFSSYNKLVLKERV